MSAARWSFRTSPRPSAFEAATTRSSQPEFRAASRDSPRDFPPLRRHRMRRAALKLRSMLAEHRERALLVHCSLLAFAPSHNSQRASSHTCTLLASLRRLHRHVPRVGLAVRSRTSRSTSLRRRRQGPLSEVVTCTLMLPRRRAFRCARRGRRTVLTRETSEGAEGLRSAQASAAQRAQ